jgi:AraC-like DNA-binding protein
MMVVRDRYIRATTLVGFQELVDDAGGDAAALLRAASISETLLTQPDGLMSYNKLGNLLEIASQELSRPSLGLEWSLRTQDHAPNFGPLILLAKFVDTLQEWIDTGLEYWKFHTNAFTMLQLEDEKTGLAALRYTRNSCTFPTRQLTETVLANLCSMTRKVTERPDAKPALIRFQHGRPSDLSYHERAFRCPIEFGSEHDEIVFHPEMLGYKTNGNLKYFKPLVGHYIKSRIQRMPVYDQSMATTIALAIPSIMGMGKCNIEFISESLGLTPKKLQRLLANEDTTFSKIFEIVRKNMACQFLVESDAPVAHIARLLDYSATTPFTLAFKRWTGMSPLEFRKQERFRMNANPPQRLFGLSPALTSLHQD